MDHYHSWKRTEDIEIDLADLLKKLCMQWKRILICALAGAVILFGYGVIKTRKADLQNYSAQGEEIQQEMEQAMSKEEEQGVVYALDLEKEIQQMEEYMEHSILMQTDPYHRNRSVMFYSIAEAKGKELQRITESYLNFIINGGLADALKKAGRLNEDRTYFREIITAYQKSASLPYQITKPYDEGTDMLSETFFYVEISGRDKEMTQQLAQNIQSELESFCESARKKAGDHKLLLLSSQMDECFDSSLLEQQKDRREQLAACRANLKTAVDAFSVNQLAAYRKVLGIENEEIIEVPGDTAGSGGGTESTQDGQELEESGRDGGFRVLIKFLLIGMLGGAFGYVCIYSFWYLMQDTVRSEKEIKRLYTFPYLGSVSLEKPHADRVFGRIRTVCKKQGITEISFVSGLCLNEGEKECLEHLKKRLGECGIQAAVIENASEDAAVWDIMAACKNVLAVCRFGETTHKMIDEEMEFYYENDIAVLGAVSCIRQEGLF